MYRNINTDGMMEIYIDIRVHRQMVRCIDRCVRQIDRQIDGCLNGHIYIYIYIQIDNRQKVEILWSDIQTDVLRYRQTEIYLRN